MYNNIPVKFKYLLMVSVVFFSGLLIGLCVHNIFIINNANRLSGINVAPGLSYIDEIDEDFVVGKENKFLNVLEFSNAISFWGAKIEDAEYSVYIRNLKSFGCPDDLVWGIVNKDLDSLYNNKLVSFRDSEWSYDLGFILSCLRRKNEILLALRVLVFGDQESGGMVVWFYEKMKKDLLYYGPDIDSIIEAWHRLEIEELEVLSTILTQHDTDLYRLDNTQIGKIFRDRMRYENFDKYQLGCILRYEQQYNMNKLWGGAGVVHSVYRDDLQIIKNNVKSQLEKVLGSDVLESYLSTISPGYKKLVEFAVEHNIESRDFHKILDLRKGIKKAVELKRRGDASAADGIVSDLEKIIGKNLVYQLRRDARGLFPEYIYSE